MSLTYVNRGHFYTPHVSSILLDCNFIVDSTNGNGFGVRSLKGQGIKNVYMNTSAAFTGTSHTSTLIDGISGGTGSLKVGMPVQGSGIPALTTIASIVDSGSITLSAATSSSTTGSITYQAVGSPNPAAGYIYVTFMDNYNRSYGGLSSFGAPVSGTPIAVTSGVTAGNAYTIVTLGTTSTAQWQKLGLPAGVTPAVGASFVAPITTTATGTGYIEAPLSTGSGIDHVEFIGDPNQTLGPIPMGGSPYVGGSQVLACFLSNTLTAPTNGAVISLGFYLGQSTVAVKGE